jgi:hypothetical protein
MATNHRKFAFVDSQNVRRGFSDFLSSPPTSLTHLKEYIYNDSKELFWFFGCFASGKISVANDCVVPRYRWAGKWDYRWAIDREPLLYCAL